MMPVVKEVQTKVEFTTDTPVKYGGSNPTWTEIPVVLIHGDTDARATEPETVETLNGLQGQAADMLDAAYALIYDTDESYYQDLQSAADDWTPIWFRETPEGQDPRIIGGENGGIVTFSKEIREFGDVEVRNVGMSATSATPGKTIEVDSGGS